MESTQNRFGSIKKFGGRTHWTQDLYHRLLTMQWYKFFFAFVAFFILFNVFFGVMYWLLGKGLSGTDGSFWHAFVFSVQTFSTVGYGVFSPRTDAAQFITIVESFSSVFVTAVLTGLVFAKFARPTARVVFSKNILIHDFDGRRVLTFRLGNLRDNQIAEAQVSVVALMNFKSRDGQRLRRQVDLKLMRKNSLFFALTWSIYHVVDEESPLFGLTIDDITSRDIEFGVSVIGYDSTYSQTVHASAIYASEDVVFDRYFSDVLDIDKSDGTVRAIHYERFHDLAN